MDSIGVMSLRPVPGVYRNAFLVVLEKAPARRPKVGHNSSMASSSNSTQNEPSRRSRTPPEA